MGLIIPQSFEDDAAERRHRVYFMPGLPIKVLLQTTIPTTVDDWCIARFSLFGQFLREQRRNRAPLFEVTMRDRESLGAPDSVLSTLDHSRFDEMWLFAVDVGNGLTAAGRYDRDQRLHELRRGAAGRHHGARAKRTT